MHLGGAHETSWYLGGGLTVEVPQLTSLIRQLRPPPNA